MQIGEGMRVQPAAAATIDRARPAGAAATRPAEAPARPADAVADVPRQGAAAKVTSLVTIRDTGPGVGVRMSKRIALKESGWVAVGLGAGSALGVSIARGLGPAAAKGFWGIVAAGAVSGAIIFGREGWQSIKADMAADRPAPAPPAAKTATPPGQADRT